MGMKVVRLFLPLGATLVDAFKAMIYIMDVRHVTRGTEIIVWAV